MGLIENLKLVKKEAGCDILTTDNVKNCVSDNVTDILTYNACIVFERGKL